MNKEMIERLLTIVSSDTFNPSEMPNVLTDLVNQCFILNLMGMMFCSFIVLLVARLTHLPKQLYTDCGIDEMGQAFTRVIFVGIGIGGIFGVLYHLYQIVFGMYCTQLFLINHLEEALRWATR